MPRYPLPDLSPLPQDLGEKTLQAQERSGLGPKMLVMWARPWR